MIGRVAAAVVSALATACAFPTVGWQALAWVALVPLFVAVRRATGAGALALIALWLVLFASIAGDWFPRAVASYYGRPPAFGFVVFAFVFFSMGAPYYAVFALAYRRLARGGRSPHPWLVASAWVAAEFLRGRLFNGSPVFLGNPWGVLGYSQVGIDRLMQLAAVTGIYGVSFVVVAVNAALAEVWLGRVAPRRLVVAALPAVVAFAYGATALRTADGTVPIAIVQGHVDLGATWRPEFYGRNLGIHLRLTTEAIARYDPTIVFWPENALTFFVADERDYQAAITALLRAPKRELIAGGPSGSRHDGYRNSVYLFHGDGTIRGRYDKQYLVPFGEYFPFASIEFLRRRFERVQVFAPGADTPPLPTAIGPAGIVVCNEAMLPEVVGRRVANGAVFLVNPANDSWLADAKYSQQQLDIVSVRAIEQRRWLVRASTSGPSAIIDPYGRVRVVTPVLTQTITGGRIDARRDRTLYGRFGDVFALGCLAITIVALCSPAIGSRASRWTA